MPNARQYWIGFNHVAGVGPVRLEMLHRHFGSLEAAWNADERALQAAGLDRRTLDNLLHTRKTLDLGRVMRTLDEIGATALTLEDDDYPPLLKELPDAPPVLYVRGSITRQDRWAVAVVGTRKASTYGRNQAYNLAGDLARSGVTVVSGLALGADAAAHRGALDAGGRTLAVLPCGIDLVYPPEHRAFAQEIMACGALMSEFPPGTLAEGKNFPPRNRIISGLSLGVVVVEAALQSGAIITADCAAEQGREVFAVPGNATVSTSQGTNRLIQDGAKLVMTADDVLTELNLTRDTAISRTEAQAIAPENDQDRRIVEQLGEEPVHIDDLCRALGLPIAALSSALMLLELKGLVRQVGGMQYIRAQGRAAPHTVD